MPSSSSGVAGILVGVVGVGVLMTVMFGDWAHWIPIILAVYVSLKAMRNMPPLTSSTHQTRRESNPMPLKTNVGVNRKVADQNYGSRGASVNLEFELDPGLIQEPERLQERIRQVFRLAQQAVDEELSRQTSSGTATRPPTPTATTNGNGNGHAAPRRSGGRRATASQARALRAIADRQHLDLAAELQHRYGVQEPEDLSITEASTLIDELKASANSTGNGRQPQ